MKENLEKSDKKYELLKQDFGNQEKIYKRRIANKNYGNEYKIK